MFVDNKDKLFCEVGIDLSLLNKEQVDKALEQQRVDSSIGVNKPIGAYLFEANILTKDQIAQILKIQDKYEKPLLVSPQIQSNSQPSTNQNPSLTPTQDLLANEIASWDTGSKIILLSGALGFISLFMGWINAGIIQQNGFQQEGYIFLLFGVYPVYKANYSKPLSKILVSVHLVFLEMKINTRFEQVPAHFPKNHRGVLFAP